MTIQQTLRMLRWTRSWPLGGSSSTRSASGTNLRRWSRNVLTPLYRRRPELQLASPASRAATSPPRKAITRTRRKTRQSNNFPPSHPRYFNKEGRLQWPQLSVPQLARVHRHCLLLGDCLRQCLRGPIVRENAQRRARVLEALY